MAINRSTRHQKIIGDFGEMLTCNWLSRSGFEVTIVDHTGIDIVAYSPAEDCRYGITVKSRTRTAGTETESVHILSSSGRTTDREKLLAACKAFACEPWIAVYVETEGTADLYLTSLKNYDEKYRGSKDAAVDGWKMTRKHRREYVTDPKVKHIAMAFQTDEWW